MDVLDRMRTRAAKRRLGQYLGHSISRGCFNTHDYNLGNASGASFRSDANDCLGAVVTWNSATADPATMFARMRHVRTDTGVVKRRNAANSGWLIESTDDETRVLARGSNTMLDASDIGKHVNFSGSFTQTFDASATLGDGWHVSFKNSSGTIVFDPNGAETVNGGATLTIPPYHGGVLWCNGSGLNVVLAPSMDNGQLPFPATQNASSDANTLDDYEEGTWTPALTFATAGDLTVAYSGQNGIYTKIGRVAFETYQLTTSTFTHTTASGNSQVTGGPFSTPATYVYRGPLGWSGITKASYTGIVCAIAASASAIEMRASGSGQAVSNVTTADMPTGGTVALNGSILFNV